MSIMPDRSPPPSRADFAIVTLAIALPTAVTWLYFIALDGADRRLQQGAYSVGKTIQFALPLVWIGLVHRIRLTASRPPAWSLVVGGALGFAVAAAMMVLYLVVLKPAGMFAGPAAAVRAKVESFGAGSPPAFVLLALFYSAIHSLLEEYYWRWFVFKQLSRYCTLVTAVGTSSFAFATHHVLVLGHYFGWTSPLTWLFTTGVIVGGAFWAWLYAKSGSLLGPWLSHALVDAAIFAIGYQIITT